ncbi:acyl carrier protein [Paenibacillus sp. BR2-3]|uniref:acyl carrier protein n=1 Tax=Paenibacillus sp. BR2-3 TaxID=3048494 RepID=UPI003977385F
MQEKLFEIIGSVCYFDREDMHPGLSVEDDLAISSVMIVEIVAMIENELGVNMEEHVNELIGCTVLGEMVQLIEQLYQEKSLESMPGR